MNSTRIKRTLGLSLGLTMMATAVQADISLPGKCVFPEGITSTSDGSLYVGSMQHGSIYRVPAGSEKAEVFVKDNSNDLVATLGVYADEANNRLIACSADPGIYITEVGDDRFTGKAGTGLRVFDLKTGAAISSAQFPVGGFCNDITVDSRGVIFATDTFHGRVIRYDGKDLSVLAMGGVLSDRHWTLNGIDYRAEDNSLYIVNQSTGQLFRLGLDDKSGLKGIDEVSLSRSLKVPDGLRFIDKGTLGVLEAGAGQYSTIKLSDGAVNVVSTGLAGTATFAPARGKAWVTAAQGGEFWSAEGSCEKASHPFTIIETKLR